MASASEGAVAERTGVFEVDGMAVDEKGVVMRSPEAHKVTRGAECARGGVADGDEC
jgi:hypothetical protein